MDKEKNIKGTPEEVETYSGIGKVFIFEKRHFEFDEDGKLLIPSDVIVAHLSKDKKPLTPPEPLTVKIDYSNKAFTADTWIYDVPDNFGRRTTERNFEMAALIDPVTWESKHYNATKLASSVLPVSSISPFRVEMHNTRYPFWTPVIFKRNIYNIGHLVIPSPEAFRSLVPSDSIAGPKKI